VELDLLLPGQADLPPLEQEQGQRLAVLELVQESVERLRLSQTLPFRVL
jgi:hypothetical protein